MFKLTIVGKNFYSDTVVLFVGYFVDEIVARRTAHALAESYRKELNTCVEVFFEKQ